MVGVHISSLRQNLEKDPRHPELILTVVGMGIKAGDLISIGTAHTSGTSHQVRHTRLFRILIEPRGTSCASLPFR